MRVIGVGPCLWTVPGGDHNDLRETAGLEYRERLRRFYASLQIPALAHQQ